MAEPAAAAAAAPLVRLRGVSKRYGPLTAVAPLDLDVAAGDFLAILGPSGCGKITLLRMIGGFVAPTAGTIEIAGAEVTRLPPDRRPTNMVFQGYGLFPHMTSARTSPTGWSSPSARRTRSGGGSTRRWRWSG